MIAVRCVMITLSFGVLLPAQPEPVKPDARDALIKKWAELETTYRFECVHKRHTLVLDSVDDYSGTPGDWRGINHATVRDWDYSLPDVFSIVRALVKQGTSLNENERFRTLWRRQAIMHHDGVWVESSRDKAGAVLHRHVYTSGFGIRVTDANKQIDIMSPLQVSVCSLAHIMQPLPIEAVKSNVRLWDWRFDGVGTYVVCKDLSDSASAALRVEYEKSDKGGVKRLPRSCAAVYKGGTVTAASFRYQTIDGRMFIESAAWLTTSRRGLRLEEFQVSGVKFDVKPEHLKLSVGQGYKVLDLRRAVRRPSGRPERWPEEVKEFVTVRN